MNHCLMLLAPATILLSGCTTLPDKQACTTGIENAYVNVKRGASIPVYLSTAEESARSGDYGGCLQFLRLVHYDSDTHSNSLSRQTHETWIESQMPTRGPNRNDE